MFLSRLICTISLRSTANQQLMDTSLSSPVGFSRQQHSMTSLVRMILDETSMPVLDDDGDVQMTESQWVSQPSEISFPPIASSPTTISLSPSNSLAQVNADGVTVAAAALPAGKDECVVVCSDESVLSVTDERSAKRGTS